MKKRIVQLQIGAAAIAAIPGTEAKKCISVFRRFGHCLRKRAEYRGKCNRSQWKDNMEISWQHRSGIRAVLAHCLTTPDFNDSAWKSAAGKFGAEKGRRISFNGFTPTSSLQQYHIKKTANVLRHFSSVQLLMHKILIRSLLSQELFSMDDAVAVYLNGQLITSADMPDEKHENNLIMQE